MPKVCVVGDSLSTGHICAATTTIASSNQSKVRINTFLACIIDDPTVAHPFPPSPPCAPHVANINAGSSKVKIGGIGIARIGDSADAGSMTSGQAPCASATGIVTAGG